MDYSALFGSARHFQATGVHSPRYPSSGKASLKKIWSAQAKEKSTVIVTKKKKGRRSVQIRLLIAMIG